MKKIFFILSFLAFSLSVFAQAGRYVPPTKADSAAVGIDWFGSFCDTCFFEASQIVFKTKVGKSNFPITPTMQKDLSRLQDNKLKATKTALQSSINLKADQSALNTEIVNRTNAEGNFFVKGDTLNKLATKDNINYVDAKIDGKTLSISGQNLTLSGSNTVVIPVADTTFKQLSNYNLRGGLYSMKSVTTGSNNIALGDSSLTNVSTQSGNVSIGAKAMLNSGLGTTSTISAKNNIAIGYEALYSSTRGSYNIAIGYQAVRSSLMTNNNIGIGTFALTNATTGGGNFAIGYSALGQNISGANNIGFGYNVLGANTSGSNNIALGYQAANTVTTGSNNVVVGNTMTVPNPTGSNQLNINNWITGIDGKIAMPSIPVYADDAAADSDTTLVSGSFYRLTGSRVLYQKP